ncbi:unnamed protein product [Thelazia callipaeda]|uniref:mRNA_decap_C domain-containing protein n=1 Tax=Thelazia callipaeda TaxID=103827 RepID=A0A0N5CZ57_THECL|nr:unnamed protein product [Thelazia callipaeda]
MGDAILAKKKPLSIDEMNLNSIQRLDPCAVSIIDKTAHAALYHFNKSKTEWVKTTVEGPLFLYKRADKPLHSLMIANRQSLMDHIEPIIPSLQFFLETPYIFINTQENDIRGFWFFDEVDCVRFYKVLIKLTSMSSPLKFATDSNKTAAGPEQNGCSSRSVFNANKSNADVGTTQMPTVLQQLLSDQSARKLPMVPITGALSADQIEHQFLFGVDKNTNNVLESKERIQIAQETQKYPSSSGAHDHYETLSHLLGNLSPSFLDSSVEITSEHSATGKKDVDVVKVKDKSASSPIVPLTKGQLLNALEELLKDDDFLTRLHCAYLKNINVRLGLRD